MCELGKLCKLSKFHNLDGFADLGGFDEMGEFSLTAKQTKRSVMKMMTLTMTGWHSS